MDFIFALAISAHLGLANDYNFVHPHFRLESDNFIAGSYINSLAKPSNYIGITYKPLDNMFIDFGLVSGYPTDVNIFGRLGINYKNFNLFVAPAYEKNNNGIVLGLEHKFKIGD